MKRCLTILLAVVLFLLPCGTAVTAEKKFSDSENSNNMLHYLQETTHNMLIKPSNYAYMDTAEKLYDTGWFNDFLLLASIVINTDRRPDKEKYMEILINVIAAYDMDNAADINHQKKQDNLKSLKDYGIDIAKIGADAVSSFTKIKSLKGELTDLQDDLSKAIDCLDVLAENANNWVDALTNLETITQDFSHYDAFLKCIAENADGELKAAASTLRNSLKHSFQLKLQSYNQVTFKNSLNYTFFLFDDAFFDAVKADGTYKTDATFKSFIDASGGIWEKFSTIKSAWDLSQDIGKLVGNLSVGGENLINRTMEIEALYDISRVLQSKVNNVVSEFYRRVNVDNKMAEECIDEYISFANFLIGCRIRGEYCVYSILAKDAGLLSLLSDKKDADSWYNSQSSAIMRMKERISRIKTNYLAQLNEFVSSGQWAFLSETEIQEVHSEFSSDEIMNRSDINDPENWSVADKNKHIFDINGDGIPEMMLRIEHNTWGGPSGPTANTELVTFKEGKPHILMHAHWTGGSILGDNISVCQNSTDHKYYIAYHSILRADASNYGSSTTYYNYEDDGVSEVHTIRMQQSFDWSNKSADPKITYTVDDRPATKEEYTAISGSFVDVDYEDLESVE